MIPQKSGVIINTTSGTAMTPRPHIAPYGASKAAVSYMTQALATEVARYGIRVNAFTPGVTDTPFWRRFRSEEDIQAAYDAGEVGQPEDIVPTVIFLASEASREISGAIIPRQIFVAKGDPA
jgi:NAD(P)-dependent dehydrogenase (short-subunit alcohol dehydrogenase family)